MPCQQCANGAWECGTNSLFLCKPHDDWTEVGMFCLRVLVNKDKDGKCMVRLVPASCRQYHGDAAIQAIKLALEQYNAMEEYVAKEERSAKEK
jgi:hypothetical protein